jgi:hypothetical protein
MFIRDSNLKVTSRRHSPDGIRWDIGHINCAVRTHDDAPAFVGGGIGCDAGK